MTTKGYGTMNRHRATLALLLGALLVAATPALADPQARQTQGMDYFKTGKYAQAVAEFQALVDESPAYDFGHFMLGLSLAKSGKTADAERSLLRAIELNGDKFEYHHALAKSYYDRGELAKVIQSLNNAEPLAANDQQKEALYQMRGYALAAREQWSDAIEDLERAKRYDSSARTLTQLGKAYFSLRHNDKAVENFRAALAKDPSQPETHQLLAEALLNMGAEATSDATKKKFYADAVREADEFSRLSPNSLDARYLVGRAALGAGQYQKAIEAFDKVLTMKSNHCNAMVNMGKAYMALQNWGSALQAMANATTCNPGMAVAWESKGFALQKQKKYDEAIKAYEKAMAIKPSPQVRDYIELCRQNKDVVDYNQSIEAQEAEQAELVAAEKARLEEERRKAEEWKQRQKDD